MVSLTTNSIPTINKKPSAVVESDNLIMLSVMVPKNSELKIDGQIELIINNMPVRTKVVGFDDDAILVERWENFNKSFPIMIYGPVVDDFHNIDKSYLSIMSIAGIQELYKMIYMLTKRVEYLENTN